MIQSTLLKLQNLFSNGNILSSLFCAEGDVVSTLDATEVTTSGMKLFANGFIDFILNFIYSTCTFVMSIIELMQYTFSKIIGITVDVRDYVLLDNKNPLIRILSDEYFSKVFRYLTGVAILLVIIFTIFSIIKSEYNFAVNSGPFVSKGRIFARSLRSFFIMGLFPFIFLFVVVITNAILAGFNDILKGDNKNTTLAGQIFISSAYQANNYRRYADADTRIPILINFNDPISLGQDEGYTTEQLRVIYKDFEEKGKKLYGDLGEANFESFTDTVYYKNNKVVNKSAYTGYEKFICTAEQYYVMADFIDYAVKTNMTYYVKNMADTDIDWGYVDAATFNREEGTLKITYKDVNYLNDGESYTITYAPEAMDVSTPISDALDTISALLAIGDYGDNQFNTLKRLEDSINVVEWETDLAYFKFSNTVDATKINYRNELTLDKDGDGVYEPADGDEYMDIAGQTPGVYDVGYTEADRILFYELHKFKYNNTLNYTLDDIKDGITLPVYKLEKRFYQASTASYVVSATHYVVKINNTYYEVKQNPELRDEFGSVMTDQYGDYYYTFIADSAHTTNLTPVNVTDTIEGGTYTSYKKDSDDGWKDMIVEKSNGKYEVVVPAETIYNDGGIVGKLDNGEEYEDANFNGKWDGQSTYITMYDDQVSVVIKQINWPQKLITDLQTIYSGININQMIATNKWLEQLGEYVVGGGQQTGTSGNIQTGLIHPLGLIMSEFFLGEISEPDIYNDYGSLKYSSKYDEKTIKAMLLSMMGEENYFQLDAELKYFCEMFNAYMGPVLDEIAYYENFDLASGNEASIQLYTYKAYLASMMLSSSATEWMYETAQLLIGNTKIVNELELISGEYKTYQDLVDDKCAECNGSGYVPCVPCQTTPLADCSACHGTQYTSVKCSVHKGQEQACFGIVRLIELYDKVLKEQSVTEKDYAYPEFMKALKEYVSNDDSAFKDRLDIVLKSWLSDIQREWTSIKAYMELKDAYDDVEAYAAGLTGGAYNIDTDGDGVDDSYEVLEIIKKIIHVPNAEFVGVAADGKTEYTFDQIKADENLLNYVYSFRNKGGTDAFVNAELVASLQDLQEKYKDNKELYNLLTNAGHKPDVYHTELNNYFSAVRTFLERRIEFLGEDKSYQLVGERDKLQGKLNLQKVVATGAIAANLLNEFNQYVSGVGTELANAALYLLISASPALTTAFVGSLATISTLIFVEIDKIDDYDDWIKFKNGEYNFSFSLEPFATLEFKINPNDIPGLQEYIRQQETIDRLNRYYISYGLGAITQQTTSTSMTVTVNNKAYTVGQNFTRAKFIEYVLGGEYLTQLGYGVNFVEEDYEGLVNLDYKGDLTGFTTLYDFLVELGDISAVVYQMTNFVNLSASSQDEIYIGDEYLSQKDLNGDGTIADQYSDCSLAYQILDFVLERNMLAPDLIRAMFGSENFETIADVKKTDAGYDAYVVEMTNRARGTIKTYYDEGSEINDVKLEKILNSVLSYLLLTDTKPEKKNYVDYRTLTLKELRLMCFDFLINYEEQEGESVEQNEARYLGVLALACADWYTNDNPETGTVETDTGVRYTAQNCSWTKNRKTKIVGLTLSNQSQATILRLAGLENRPYQELVGAEYSINFDRDGVDEANGDVFIICTYDEDRMLYIPFMMGNFTENSSKTLYGNEQENPASINEEKTWSKTYGYGVTNTDYYHGNKLYPVVAKGIITAEGKPTAIRQNGDNIEYYRDDVVIHDVSNMGLSAYYMSMDQVTINYTATSFIANSISKLFTGKSLAENIISKIPKFAAHSDYSFCYGVKDGVKEVSVDGSCSIDFNFNKSMCISMENLYSRSHINILILVIGVYTMTIALWKALWGATQRTIDVAMLYLIAPPIISTIAFRSDSQDDKGNVVESNKDAYSRWKETLTEKLLNVFGYAIGFNIFFIVSPIISGINLFSSQAEFNEVVKNMTVFQGLSAHFVNEIGRLVLIIAAAFLSTRAVKLFTQILSIQDAFSEGASTFKNVKNTASEVVDHLSGQYIVDKAAEAGENMKNLIPGYAIGQQIANSKTVQDIKAANRQRSANRAKNKMIKKGVDPATAERLANNLKDKLDAKHKAKQDVKKDKADRRKKRKDREKAREGRK